MTNTERKIFVQLGRAGDILNVLPLAHRAFKEDGVRPLFMVATAYAGLLDGVTYVERVIYPGAFEEVILALQQARKLTANIILAQIYGWGITNQQACTSFARESWWAAGARMPWGSLPLTIDNRNAARESELVGRMVQRRGEKRFVLVAAEGNSSPFPFRHFLLRQLRARLSARHEIIDLAEIRAHRFFDLLGLFDVASCLVTVDTGHLHLAHASKVPVVSIITRDPSKWHGSPWRPNHIGRFYYDEFPKCIDDLVTKVVDAPLLRLNRPKIIHTWADWRDGDPSKELRGRGDVAQASWKTEYETGVWIPCEMTKDDAKRSGKDIGDPHNVPFAHDVIEHGMKQVRRPSDVICLTNADTGFTPGLTGLILETVERHGCAFSHRRDFEKIPAPFFSEAQVKRGKFYPGSDLFVFTAAWWVNHRAEYADFLMGREHWDEVLRQLVKYHAGASLDCAAWHEWHVSFWCDKQRWTLPGNVHNEKLKSDWFRETGFIPEDFRYFRVAEDGHLHPPTRAEDVKPV